MSNTNLSDEQKSAIETVARKYRVAVRRGDVTARWAAEDAAGRYTYPYATAAHFDAVRNHAARFVR